MNVVRILQVGYMRQEGEVYDADCTVTYVYNENEKLGVLFDTASAKRRKDLKKLIKESDLKIDYVVCSHTHYDHIGNLNLFSDKKMIVYNELISEGKLVKSGLLDEKNDRYYLTGDRSLYVLYTPGHSHHDVSLVCENAHFHNEKIQMNVSQCIVVAGDVFDDGNDEGVWHLYSSNVADHRRSREQLLKIANVIVPGHGDFFLVK